MKLLFFGLLLLTTQYSLTQQIYPELTAKIKGLESPKLEEKVENLYQKKLVSKPKENTDLKLWKLYIFDSLGVSGKADTLAIELVEEVKILKYPVTSKIYARLGNLEVENNQFKKGISFFHTGMKIARKFSDSKSVGNFQRQIGTAYLKLEQNQTAEQYLRESLSTYRGINDSLGMANAMISLGNSLKDQGEIDEAIKYYSLSLDLAKKLNNQRLIAGNYNNLGNAERKLKNQRKALDYYFKALEMNVKSDNKLWQSFNYHNIANSYVDLKQYNQAIGYFKKSNAIKQEIGDSLSLITGYLGLSDVYADVNDYKNAYDYLKMHVDLKDKLNLVEQANLLKDLELKYQSKKKEVEISHLKTSKQFQEMKNESLEMKAQKNLNLLTIVILAGLIALGAVAVLWRANKSRRKANELLNSKNEIIGNANNTLHNALSELSQKNREIIDSINYATYIQRATLPNISQHTSDVVQFELFFAPKDIVSGDFYFSFQLYNRSIFGVADCTGHGVPGAMVSLVGMNSLEKVIREEKHTHTGEMVESLNRHVLDSLNSGDEMINDGMDISFCHLDHENSMLHFTGANHAAYIIRNNVFIDENIFDQNVIRRGRIDDFTLLSVNGTRRPVGKSHTNEPFSQVTLKLFKGDRIVLFSDGYADQIGGNLAKKLKKGAMLEFILRSATLIVSDQAEFMKNQFDKWKGDHEQVDDVCMLFVEVKR